MPMRELVDRENTPLSLMGLGGDYARGTRPQSSPYLERTSRLSQGRRAMGHPGIYVAGLDELEAEIKRLTMHTEVWAPPERWYARLQGCDDWDRKVRYQLKVYWYQEAGGPMERLASIMVGLDFKQYAVEIPIDID